MLLSNLDKNINAKIIKIDCKDELKQRFYSFGLIQGTQVSIEKISPTKGAIVLLVDDTSVAIRLDEAKYIKVEVI
jgi:Fe2+ transport system protein FeoA